eukprot:TRINITY_DN40666_c0_g1_i1.p1 TRINITY_DN40666_c0_g1~~TRINITY_DN40666_c0_g1_i1.p1  ORF type:complete len:219 (+),score=38.80 TRINITY_DN40666_c0_g1_i1:113-769(+)
MGLRFLLLCCTCLLLQASVHSLEKPQYTVIHTESDFEIRLYRDSSWMSTDPLHLLSFEKATRKGFHRLFQYIEGANLNSSRIAMTVPVLTRIVSGAGPFDSSGYVVSFYLPAKFQDSPPVPLPGLHLHADKWDSHCIAVRKFLGFARDKNIVSEAESLAISLQNSPWAKSSLQRGEDFAYAIAQYNSPFQLIGRVNEVWAIVKGPISENCVEKLIAKE